MKLILEFTDLTLIEQDIFKKIEKNLNKIGFLINAYKIDDINSRIWELSNNTGKEINVLILNETDNDDHININKENLNKLKKDDNELSNIKNRLNYLNNLSQNEKNKLYNDFINKINNFIKSNSTSNVPTMFKNLRNEFLENDKIDTNWQFPPNEELNKEMEDFMSNEYKEHDRSECNQNQATSCCSDNTDYGPRAMTTQQIIEASLERREKDFLEKKNRFIKDLITLNEENIENPVTKLILIVEKFKIFITNFGSCDDVLEIINSMMSKIETDIKNNDKCMCENVTKSEKKNVRK